jgi:hypothetical protein
MARDRQRTICMKMKIFFFSLLAMLSAIPMLAQDVNQDAEQRKRSDMMRNLDEAVALMDDGKYAAADEKYRYILENLKSVPSDLTFFFGKNSFYLNKFQQSADWLNKYIQLKGTTGQYHEEAIKILKSAETEIVKEKTAQIEKAGQVLSRNYDIDCGPSGKVSCPVCKGDHVIVKRGPFGDEYKTCPYCNDHGMLTCQEYNQLLRGELKAKR